MPGLIGKKVGMTSTYSAAGKNIPCTIIEAGPCVVTQLKTEEKDGYSAVQIGYGERREINVTKPMAGHFKKSKTDPKAKLVEVDGFEFEEEVTLGQEIKVENVFNEGEYVEVTGVSKGKGFQGVVKRHGFGGVGQQTHGQHNRGRAPGSIGAASDPARVFKGMRMAGRTGGKRSTVENLEVLKVLPEDNMIVVKGSIPGHKGAYVVIWK